MLRILGLSGTAVAVILHRRPGISGPANTQHSLSIDMDAVIMEYVVVQPSADVAWYTGGEEHLARGKGLPLEKVGLPPTVPTGTTAFRFMIHFYVSCFCRY